MQSLVKKTIRISTHLLMVVGVASLAGFFASLVFQRNTNEYTQSSSPLLGIDNIAYATHICGSGTGGDSTGDDDGDDAGDSDGGGDDDCGDE
jgi:hypothetical protein